jgi:hypothetical protein
MMFLTKNKLIGAIQGIVEQLNSTYLQELKEDNERYAWFKGGNGGDC